MNIDLEKILFIDTESNPVTKQPECISWLYGQYKGIIREFNYDTYKQMCDLWSSCDAVMMFNAVYDCGVLSIMYPQNSYEWKTKIIEEMESKSSMWRMEIFKNVYGIRKISSHRNFIKTYHEDNEGKYIKGDTTTPIIDLLKLWSILIDEGKDWSKYPNKKYAGIGLKSLIYNELDKNPIEYSAKNALTDAYCYQDVECLKELTKLFFEKIERLDEVNTLSLEEWSKIVTPATFVKMLYEREYGSKDIKKMQKSNDRIIKSLKLNVALEQAFHGGITLSMYRGEIKEGFWLDIKGAYSKAIEVLNTDKYMSFDIESVDVKDINFVEPHLLKVKANFILKSINGSLKLFYVEVPHQVYIWNFDITACNNLIDDFKYTVLEAYKIIPCCDIKESLPVTWNNKKNEEKKWNGKTTLYEFYKFLSNTSYGIKAQRKPFTTKHTNMVIAGMITSKVHEVLTTIIKVTREHGYKNLYNDTDSAFSEGKYSDTVYKAISTAIAPFEVEYEGSYDFNKFLSLKRYVSIKGHIGNTLVSDKIKLHGKGRYSVSQKEILEYTLTQTLKEDAPLNISQFVANTQLGIKMILNQFPQLDRYKHPFMFVRDVESKILKSEFMDKWYTHIDTKTTTDKKKDSFYREFRRFYSMLEVLEFFEECKPKEIKENEASTGETDTGENYRNWDAEIMEDFDI